MSLRARFFSVYYVCREIDPRERVCSVLFVGCSLSATIFLLGMRFYILTKLDSWWPTK